MSTSPSPLSIRPGAEISLRDALEAHRQLLLAELERGVDGWELGQRNARFLDACIEARFEAAMRTAGRGKTQRLALGAAGSFGRGAVALRSDADLVFVVETGEREAASSFVEALLYPLWDAGLPIGHQVLSAGEALSLAQRDLATATALLDLTVLAGDA